MKSWILGLVAAALATSSFAATETSVGAWPHDWTPATLTPVAKSGTQWTIARGFLGSTETRVDARGTVYFGIPKVEWVPGGNPSLVGVPFIALMGGQLPENPAEMLVSVGSGSHLTGNHIQISRFRPAHFPTGSYLEGQVVSTKDPALRIAEEIRFNWNIVRPAGLEDGLFHPSAMPVVFYDGTSLKPVTALNEEIERVVDRKDFAILADGKIWNWAWNDLGCTVPDHWVGASVCSGYPFGSSEMFWWSIPSTDGKRAVHFQANPFWYDQNGHGMGWSTGGNFLYFENDDFVPDFSEFSAIRVKAKVHDTRDCWRVWTFDDKMQAAHLLGIPCIDQAPFASSKNSEGYSWTTVPVGVLGDRINNFNIADNQTGYPINARMKDVKVMGSVQGRKCTKESCQNDLERWDILGDFDLDSIIIQRNQPQSFTVVSRDLPVDLKAQVIGSHLDGITVSFQPIGAGTQPAAVDLPIDAKGVAVLTNAPSAAYVVKPYGQGRIFSPAMREWTRGEPPLLLFQQFNGSPKWNDGIAFHQVQPEGHVKTIDLNAWVSDPSYPGSRFMFTVQEVGTKSGLAWSLDATTGLLTLGSSISDANGSTKLTIIATSPSGAPLDTTIEYTVMAVNDAPTILASTWQVDAGKVLVIDLNERLNGKLKWVSDPDDSYLNLSWSAEWATPPPAGTSMALVGAKLTLTPDPAYTGDLSLKLTVRDQAGLSTSRTVIVKVIPPLWEVIGMSGRQDAYGSLVFEFGSRYSVEPLNLQAGVVEIQTSQGLKKFPASLEVLQAPGFNANAPTDGLYRVVVLRGAQSGDLSLFSLMQTMTKAEAGIPLGALGRTKTVPASVQPVDYSGPGAALWTTFSYAVDDLFQRTPQCRVSWNWFFGIGVPQKVVAIPLTSGAPRVEIQVPTGASQVLLTGLQDSASYVIHLVANDQHGNPGGGTTVIRTPSGRYPSTLLLNDATLPEVTGTIVMQSNARGQEDLVQDLSLGNGGRHSLPFARLGTWFIKIEDPLWIGSGGTLRFDVTRAGAEASWTLVPKAFLAPGSAVVEQLLDQGGLNLRVGVSNTFADETPIEAELTVKSGTTSMNIKLPIPATGVQKQSGFWNITWKRSELPQDLAEKAVLVTTAAKSFIKVKLTTALSSEPGKILRSEEVTTAEDGKQGRLVAFDAPKFFDEDENGKYGQARTVYEGGRTWWSSTLSLRHGVQWRKEICEQTTTGELSCRHVVPVPLESPMAVKPAINGAFRVGAERTLVGSGTKVGSVEVPRGAAQAAAQWPIYIKTAGDYHIRAAWNFSQANTVQYTLDSGKTWTSINKPSSRYPVWGTAVVPVHLDAGWVSLGMKLGSGVILDGIAIQAKGSKAPAGDQPFLSQLPVADAEVSFDIIEQLEPNRNYEERDTLIDAYGNMRAYSESFRTDPNGLFSDLIVTQTDSRIVELRTATTHFDPPPANSTSTFHVRIEGKHVNPLSIQAQGQGMLIQLDAKDFPAAMIGAASVRPNTIQMTLVNDVDYSTYSTRSSCDFGWFNCKTQVVQTNHRARNPISMNWTNHSGWHSTTDVRALPALEARVVHRGLDSIALVVTGYDQVDAIRKSMAGKVTAKWTPGSQCALSTTRTFDVRHVFAASLNGAVAWSPRAHGAWWVKAGAPIALMNQPESPADKPAPPPALSRQQWVDIANGGGFFPALPVSEVALTAEANRPSIAFAIRNPSNLTRLVRLAILPGQFSGQARQKFQYRLQPVNEASSRPSREGRGFYDQLHTGWAWATETSDAVLQLEPGMNVFEITMIDPGIHLRGLALVPVDVSGAGALPTTAETQLATIGSEGMFQVEIGAGSLSPATQHEFELQAHDQWGNPSPVSRISMSTLAPAFQLPRVQASIAPWDNSGWINAANKPFIATLRAAEGGYLPETAILHARLVRRNVSSGFEESSARDLIVTPSADQEGVWTASLSEHLVDAFQMTDIEYAEGTRIVLEAWFTEGSWSGPHAGMEFGVRGGDRGALRSGISTTAIGNLTFHPRRVWDDLAGNVLADLEFPKLTLQEDDSAINRLVLRGAKILIAPDGASLSQVSGGVFAAEHCKLLAGLATECRSSSKMPVSVGRWPGWLEVSSLKLSIDAQNPKIEVKELSIVDDLNRPVRNFLIPGGVDQWDDNGFVGSLEMSKDRFWFKNVLASTAEEAFGIEACRTTLTKNPTAPGVLQILTRGCTDGVGPFLTFPLHLKTEGAWSLIGQAFDSIPAPYSLTWGSAPMHQILWANGAPVQRGNLAIPPSNITITKSALKHVTGASMWGFSVNSYTFGPAGIGSLDFDLEFPDGSVAPYQDGTPQSVRHFLGGTITTTSATMAGKPVLVGTPISTEAQTLKLGRSLQLEGATKWTFKREEGTGWILLPEGTLFLSRAQIGGWKYTKIGSATQDASKLSFPLTSLLFGPDQYLEISGSHAVEVSTARTFDALTGSTGATLNTTVSLSPNGGSILQTLSGTKFLMPDFFSKEDGTSIPVELAEPELELDGEFGLKDIEAIGSVPENSEVRVAGTYWVRMLQSQRYQLLANRGQVLVRLFRPQAYLNLPRARTEVGGLGSDASPRGEASTEVQSAVFTTTRLPVAVGVELPVPETFQPMDLGALGSLALDRLSLDASTTLATTGDPSVQLGLVGQTNLTLGSAFTAIGLNGFRLPVRSVQMSLNVQPNATSPLTGDVSFETAPLGMALQAELTREGIAASLSGKKPAGSQSPVLVRLTTAGFPIQANYSAGNLDVSMRDWEIELTKDFPIDALANTAFHLDELSVSAKVPGTGSSEASGLTLNKLKGSGRKTFKALELGDFITLLGPAQGDPISFEDDGDVTVELGLDGTGRSSRFTLSASRILLGERTGTAKDLDNVYNLGCKDRPAATLSVGLDGDLAGSICIEISKDIAMYPLGVPDPDVYLNGAEKAIQVELTLANGELKLAILNATAKIRRIPLVAEDGLALDIKGVLRATASGITVEEASVSNTAPGISEVFTPFKMEIVKIALAYSRPSDNISLTLKPMLTMASAGGGCSGSATGDVTFTSKIENILDRLSINWGVNRASFNCTIAGLEVRAENLGMQGTDDKIRIDLQSLHVITSSGSEPFRSVFQGNSEGGDEKQGISSFIPQGAKGVVATDIWYDNATTSGRPWGIGTIYPVGFAAIKKPITLEIPGTGIKVSAIMNFEPLITDTDPGLLFEQLKFQLPRSMGDKTFNTNFDVLFNGNAPYAHPKGSSRIPFEVPRMALDMLGLDEAKLVLEAVTDPGSDKKQWRLTGRAKMSLAGAIENMDALLTIQKPAEPCDWGVCKAVVTVQFAEGSRIPLGTTGLYISGLKGAFYDGYYSPPCAEECTGQSMPEGMKVELAIFLEAASPSLAKGGAGFWVHLERLNFGINGDLELMRGVADAEACAAIFRGGKQFHGEVQVELQAMLTVRGEFILDIWQTSRSNNMAAEAKASVGLKRGAIIRSRWFKFPRSTRWFGPFVTRFGRFSNGSNGFTSGVRALGRTWGVGFVNGGFKLGNVGQYKLARPTGGNSAETNIQLFEGDEYRVYPLGVDLIGGEVFAVNVGSAEGTDWNDAQIQLFEAAFREASGSSIGGGASPQFSMNQALSNSDLVKRDDSANLHSLVWTNLNYGTGVGNSGARLLVGIPKKSLPKVGETEGQNIASGADDLQVLASLMDPQIQLTAQPCASDIQGVPDVCISGKIEHFEHAARVRKRLYTDREKLLIGQSALPADAGQEVPVINQRHHLRLYALPMTGEVVEGRKENPLAIEIPIDEFVWSSTATTSQENANSLADNTGCVTPFADRIELTDCRWRPKYWPTGLYQVMAEAEVEDLLKKDANGRGEVVPLSETRQILKQPQAQDAGLFQAIYREPVAKVHGIAVFGSALDSATTGVRDERRVLGVRFDAQEHPEIMGYQIQWTDANGKVHDLETGTSGLWTFDLPDRAMYWSSEPVPAEQLADGDATGGATSDDGSTPPSEEPAASAEATTLSAEPTPSTGGATPPATTPPDGKMIGANPDFDWMFAPPAALRITPRVRQWSFVDSRFHERLATEHAENWTGTVTIGASTGDASNQISLTRSASLPIQVAQNSDVTEKIRVTVAAPFSSGTSANRPASDYARVDFQWVDATGKRLEPKDQLRAPEASVSRDHWKLRQDGTLDVSLSATSIATLCDTTEYTTKTADGRDSTFRTSACKSFDTLSYPTALGMHYLRVRVWNLGRLASSQEKTITLAVRVVPPSARIDIAEPDYLLAGRQQKIAVTVTQLRAEKEGDKVRLPMLRLLKGNGDLVPGAFLIKSPIDGNLYPADEVPLDPALAEDGRWQDSVILKPADFGETVASLQAINPWPSSLGTDSMKLDSKYEMELIRDPSKISCLEKDLKDNVEGYERSMDFIGVYPKEPRLLEPMQILFSEMHSPEFTKWTLKVKQGSIEWKDVPPVPVLDATHEGLRFVLPGNLNTTERIDVQLEPVSGVFDGCVKPFYDQLEPPLPALQNILKVAPPPFQPDGDGISGKGLELPVVQLCSPPCRKRPEERVEWVRGTPQRKQAWDWQPGIPTWRDIPQPDSVHIRVRHRDVGVLKEQTLLIMTSPRLVTLLDNQRALKITDAVAPMARIQPRVLPEPTDRRDGTSIMTLQCRFPGKQWVTCPEGGWELEQSLQGVTEIRVAWTLFGREKNTTIFEPTLSWDLRWNEPAGLKRVPLRLDGRRIGHLLDTLKTSIVLLRRSGNELPSWPAQAPVVHEAGGRALPQSTEVYDPAGKTWETWVELPPLQADQSLDLEIWMQDATTAPAPWSKVHRLSEGTGVSGYVGESAVSAGSTRSSDVSQAYQDWSVSLWTRWSQTDETLLSAGALTWKMLADGSLRADWGGDMVTSKPEVLDATGHHLLALSYRNGMMELYSNGQLVAKRRAHRGNDAALTLGQFTIGAKASIDEFRWEPYRSPASWRLRYAAERQHADLWQAWPGDALAPKPVRFDLPVGDTVPLAAPVAMWSDRDEQLTQWPVAWTGATFLPGLAGRGGVSSVSAGFIDLSGPARLCGFGSSSWRMPAPWTSAGTVSSTAGQHAVWCREAIAGINPMPSHLAGDVPSERALSWLLLPSTDAAIGPSQPLQPGNSLPGIGGEIVEIPSGLRTPTTVVDLEGNPVATDEPGDRLVVLPIGTPLPTGAVVVDQISVRSADGQVHVVLLVRWPAGMALPDGVPVLRREPVVSAPQWISGSMVEHQSQTVELADGSKLLEDSWRPVIAPTSCSERLASVQWRRPVRMWMALPPDARTSNLEGWTFSARPVLVQKRDQTQERWTLWSRDVPAGTYDFDASFLFDAGSCARWIWIGEERNRTLPDWDLATVRLRGVGGTPVLKGGQHKLSGLDMQFAAALSVRSPQYSMHLSGMTGYGERIAGVVQTLGQPRLVSRPDQATGGWEHVVASPGMVLHDLRADLLNTDSVRVDVKALRAQGFARLTIRQNGVVRFNGNLKVVLFRDRDGDFVYTHGIDMDLGVGSLGAVDPGQTVTIDFPLADQDIRYPEDLYLAWLDGQGEIREQERGTHLAMAGNPCHERKAMAWTRDDLSKVHVRVRAHLRDTDRDGRIRPQDSTDLLWVEEGKLCQEHGDGTSRWCVPNPWVGQASDVTVRDIDGDGIPEILAGRQVLTPSGEVRLDLETFNGAMQVDLDEDGRVDVLSQAGTCRMARNASGELMWSLGCAEVGRWTHLAQIERNPSGCTDVSLSGFDVQGIGMVVRVANAGSTDLPENLPLVAKDASGAEIVRVSPSRPLKPGEWVDVWMPVGPADGASISVDLEVLKSEGLLDFDSTNDSRTWTSSDEAHP